MNESQVDSKVKSDLELVAVHKEELQNIVIAPVREVFQFFDREDTELWVVGSKDEYVITFDEKENIYGLAFRNIFKVFVYLGDEGSLADAYQAYLSRNEEAAGSSSRKSGASKKKSRRKKKPDPEPW
ncbi:MAG TPA: hypothetical protein VKO63_03550 [Chitinispirillaceae bacterium]|nr:hypothetical protein [Chitinispirillaceae bacterium]